MANLLIIPHCPSCSAGGKLQNEGDVLTCRSCGGNFNLMNSVWDFVKGKKETNLDVAVYDERHKLEISEYSNIYLDFKHIISRYFSNGGMSVLEIGSGSGAWTVGMDRDNDFRAVVATDISFEFLNLLSKRLQHEKTSILCVDAEQLNFDPGAFNLVVGRSILHHILRYENVIKKAAQWLPQGGKAVFFEPVLEGKIWVAFFLNLFKRIDNRLGLDRLSSDEKRKMEGLVRHVLKDYYVENIDEIRPFIEDKYIFRVSKMKDIGVKCGFSDVTFERSRITANMTMKELVTSNLEVSMGHKMSDKYNFIFESFEATFGKAMTDYVYPGMGYFVFHK